MYKLWKYHHLLHSHHYARNLVAFPTSKINWYRHILNSGTNTYSFGDYLNDNLNKKTKVDESAEKDEMLKRLDFHRRRCSRCMMGLHKSKIAWYRHVLNSGAYTYSFGDYLKNNLNK